MSKRGTKNEKEIDRLFIGSPSLLMAGRLMNMGINSEDLLRSECRD